MTQKNETPILILSLIITAGILGGGYWWFIHQKPSFPGDNIAVSLGNEVLIPENNTPQKKAGVEAFKQGNYQEAIAQFQSSLKVQHNDPETLIYLNNAIALTQNPIKIAVVVPIGSNLNIAQEMLRGVAQAQNQVNQKGGISNRWLQVAIANDDNNPETAQKVANQIVKDSSILAVVGHNSSNTTIAAAPIYEQGQLVIISPTSNATQIASLGDYIFRTVPSVNFEAYQLSLYTIKTAKKRNIAICFDSSAEYSKSLKEDFTLATFAGGGRIVEINCDLADPNFNALSMTSEVILKGADSLFLIPAVNNIDSAIEVAQASQGRLFLLGSSTLYTFATLKAGQKAVQGMILAVPWHPDAFTDNPFPQQARQLWGGDVNWRTALSYDATEAIITALKQGEEISRQEIKKNLSNDNFLSQGSTGDIQFLPSGDRNGGSILTTIVPGNKSTAGFDFIPLK